MSYRGLRLSGIGDSRRPALRISNIAPSLEIRGLFSRGGDFIKQRLKLKRVLSILGRPLTSYGITTGSLREIEKFGSFTRRDCRFEKPGSMSSWLGVPYNLLFTFTVR